MSQYMAEFSEGKNRQVEPSAPGECDVIVLHACLHAQEAQHKKKGKCLSVKNEPYMVLYVGTGTGL